NLLTNVPKKKLNRPLGSHIEEKILALDGSPLTFKRGEEMGGFKLGSTLVLVFEAPADKGVFHVSPGDKSFLSMSRIEEFPESQIIPYDIPALVTSSIHFSLGVIGVLAVGLVLLSTAGEKNKTPGTLLLLSLCWADLAFCLSAVIIGALDLHAGGWSTGKVGCVIDGVIVFFSCCLSILSLLSITLERYLLTIWSYPTTIKMAWMWTIGIQIESVPVTTIPKVNEHSVDILSAKEKRLMFTAIIITGCFVFLWSPYLIMMIVEMFT
ncbi:hypothetical protein HDU91_001930, partial [Kappamyces sp. JEL0680]